MAKKKQPIFQRSPRLFLALPGGEVSLPAPQNPPSPPAFSAITLIVPAMVTVGGMSMMFFFSRSSSGQFPVTMLIMAMMMLGSYTVPLISYRSNKKKHKKTIEEQKERYLEVVEKRKQDLKRFWGQTQKILLQKDPPPGELLERVVNRQTCLWERVSHDPDYLSLRLGVGIVPFGVQIKVSGQENELEPNPLWESVRQLISEFQHIPEMPICLNLREAGSTGIFGGRDAVQNVIRAMMMQLVTHHAPSDVKVAVIFPAAEADQWMWMRWLPHVWTNDRKHRFMASEAEDINQLLTWLQEDFNQRKVQMNARNGKNYAYSGWVILIADPALVENNALLPRLLREGPELGFYSVFLAEKMEGVPQSCRGLVEADLHASRVLKPEVKSFMVDRADKEQADRMARSMTSIRLRDFAGPKDIPGTVTLLGLFDEHDVKELEVARRWRESEPFNSLGVPIGARAGENLLMFDLHEREHGSHGLVAGTTGAGKSELLQSLIASLAVHFHPHDLAFLLVDYKGGGMANLFADLPHLAGTITNLQGNLAVRALSALDAEKLRRLSVFSEVGVNHIDDYQKLYRSKMVKEPIPRLVIVVDEFAEMKMEQPEFMQKLVSLARVGRSVGIHLILATQKPSGVVDDQIWSNSRFKFCLRVQRSEDSREVLKREDAATITRPGRAYFQVGNDEIFELFQSAYSSAPYTPEGPEAADPQEILQVALSGRRTTIHKSRQEIRKKSDRTQLQALITHLKEVAEEENIQPVENPWLPPLPEFLSLDEVRDLEPRGWDGEVWHPVSPWLAPIIGLVDDPANRFQGPLSINLGKDGHLLVYGMPGSGKTTFLQTIAMSLAHDYSPADLNLYLLDFGGRMLTLLADLPHVGNVVIAEDREKLERLWQYLFREMETRKGLFAQAGVGTMAAYRKVANHRLPAIVVLMDNYAGFQMAYPDSDEKLAVVVREGGNLGIHLVITANSQSVVRTRVSSNISAAIALQLSERGEYISIVGRSNGLEPASVLGRGLIKGKPPLEFQTAAPVPGEMDSQRTEKIREIIREMNRVWTGERAKPIPVPPEILTLDACLSRGEAKGRNQGLTAPIGLDTDELEPLWVNLAEGPHFLIGGPPESGKSTCLKSWLLSLSQRYSPERMALYLVDFQRTGLFLLQGLPQVRACAYDSQGLEAILLEIQEQIKQRRGDLAQARANSNGLVLERDFFAQYPAIILAVDDFDAFLSSISSTVKENMEHLLRKEKTSGVHVLVAGDSSFIASSWDNLVKAVKEQQTGILLGTYESSELQMLNVRIFSEETRRAPQVGRGFWSRRGRFRRFQAAIAEEPK